MAHENKRQKTDLDMSATVVPKTQDYSQDLLGELMGIPKSKSISKFKWIAIMK